MAITLNGTTGIVEVSWTTATRPASPTTGQVGFNTTLGYLETYDGTAWLQSNIPSTGLTVASGGTGRATLTANNVLLGNGTTAVAFVAPGTSGNILKSDGTTWTSAAAAAGGFSNMQVFTSPGTFTTPATTTQIKITVVGGGGSGGGIGPNAPTGGGGGGGGAAIYVGPVTASTPYAVTVGAAVSSSAPNVTGTTGNTSSFGSLASATGGTGGIFGTSGSVAGGAGSAGTLQFTGSPGSSVVLFTAPTTRIGGDGGSSFLGGGGASNPAGSAGGNYGGGGSGGGSGAAGVVVVEY